MAECSNSDSETGGADVLAKGADALIPIAAGMLTYKIAAMVFLPWLTRYTHQVREVAQRDEREAILSIPDLPEAAKEMIRAWRER